MRLGAIPWSSRWFQLALTIGFVVSLFVLSMEVAHGQAVPPEARSEQGREIRDLWFITFGVAAVVFVLVEAAIVWIVVRYRRRSTDSGLPPQIHGSVVLEILWTAIPTVIVAVLFAASLVVLINVEASPDEDEPVEVIDVMGQQWTWGFRYSTPLGVTTTSALSEDPADVTLEVSDPSPFEAMVTQINPELKTFRVGVEHLPVEAVAGNTLTVERAVDATVAQAHAAGAAIDRTFLITESIPEGRLEGADATPVVTVPVGKTVRFNIASRDVIHSFYIPQFLYKLDANPGRVQAFWVNVVEPTGFDAVLQGQCAEFCGREHARMIFAVRALELDEYNAWLAERTPSLEPAAVSQAVDEESNEAEEVAAPSTGGDAGRGQELFFANGCNVCHGDVGQGGIGPTIAGTGFSLAQVMGQYRSPRGVMPAFDAGRVPDADVGDIYAWLQTLPLPDSIVPGEGTP